jgi:N-formylglutamate deformylase
LSAEVLATYASGAGSTPLVVSFPHVGTALPAEVEAALTPAGRRLADTDWHVDQLYSFVRDMGAAWIAARLSRYVIDLNRPPDDVSLYPGQATTSLCPTTTFDGEALYSGAAPHTRELARRRDRYWTPYHDELRSYLDAARERFGYAVLLDAHSIRSEVPRLFPGRLPDINLGTHDGRACDSSLTAQLLERLAGQSQFSHVLNGRFKGGYITRNYGNPGQGVHAVQIELAQAAYMDERTTRYDQVRAQPLQTLLNSLVAILQSFLP